jgi:hypothetical protein
VSDDTKTNPFAEYRADANRIAGMLEAVARLDGRMKARGSWRTRNAVVAETGGRAWAAAIDTNDGTFVPKKKPDPQQTALGESGSYFNRRAWNIRMCGRTAVGVGVHPQRDKGEKVFHAACQDRLCPICAARGNAHGAAAVGRLLRERLASTDRVFFFTVTISHSKADTFKETGNIMRKAWARFIRRKAVKGLWAERLRCMEVEYTKDGGWHLHFHGLCTLKPEHEKTDALDVERIMRKQWEQITTRLGRRSFQLDFRELRTHAHNEETGEISHVRYWLRPAQHDYAKRMEKAGRWQLWRNGKQLYRVQLVGSVVNELTKYITKRHADGGKSNQIPLFEWTPKMLHEYALGVKGWNLRRASAGWADILQDFEEEAILAREREEAENMGYDYFPWAEIVESCKLAAARRLTRQESDEFASIYPRILNALEVAGCDVSADQIRGYVFRFFGDPDAELQPLQASPWQVRERKQEKDSHRLANEGWQHLRARHFRVLLRLNREPGKGRRLKQLPKLGMSRQRHAQVLNDLGTALLVAVVQDDNGREVVELTQTGQTVLSALSSRKLAKDQPKAEARKQWDLFRQSKGV